jgi:hypothetical protein
MNKTFVVIAVLVIVAAGVALGVWCTLYRVVPQPAAFTAGDMNRYFYGSIEAEKAAGIPYWIWLVLPRVFPEYMPGVGGYASFGLSWEEGKEMPVGFAKQRIGYIRVTGNCALCHALSRPVAGDPVPRIIPSEAGRTTDIRPLLAFYQKCAADPRFSAGDLLGEIDNATGLSFADRLLYRFVLIPRARKRLRAADPSLLFGPTIREHVRDPKSHIPPIPLPR